MVAGGWKAAVAAVLVLVLVVTGCSGDDSDSGSESGNAGSEASQADPEQAQWAHLGRDLGNTRAALDDAVSPDNVAGLEPAWELDGIVGVTGTPIVADGTVYLGSWDKDVRALDAETGEEQWTYDVEGGGWCICGTLALDDERVFVGAFDERVVALDRATGELLWETVNGDHPLGAIFGSPIYADGLVLVGGASYELMVEGPKTFRGYLVALDAETGDEVWRYVPSDADPAPGPGVSIWGSVTVDEDTGTVFVPTGNSYEAPTSSRADSVIALDLATGEERWAHQFTSDDNWTLGTFDGPDADVGAPPNLFEVDGRPAVGVADKAGDYYALDRETGEELWSQKVTVGGLQGGALSSAAVADGAVFVASNKESRNADLAALDSETGEILWQIDVGGHVAGPVSWANGVVFLADNSGKIAGYDAASGEVLWSFATADGSAGGISIVDGTVYAGWGYNELGPAEGDAQGGLIAFRPTGTAPAADDDDDAGDSAARSGEEVYDQQCSVCHGDSGEGGTGPSLAGVADRLSRDEHVDIVENGKGDMPDWGDTLTDEEIQAVVDYQREVLSDPG